MKKFISTMIVLVLMTQLFSAYGIKADENNISSYKNKFVPPDGKTLLFIGQDDDETADYIESSKIVPAGMMIYTNLGDLSAMTSSYQGTGSNQAGRMDFQDWARRYDNTVLNLGIWASDSTMLLGIANGKYDENIKKLAYYIKNSKKPVYVRFGYEFDGPWNVYAPGLYKSAYKRFVDVVRDTTPGGKLQNGVNDNISFVWHSAAFFRLGENNIWPDVTGQGGYDKEQIESYLNNPYMTLENWYPGDEYVDWVGISWFAWEHEYQEKAADIRRDEAVAFAEKHSKPVMIAEAAPKEIWQPQNPTKNCCDNGKVCILGEEGTIHEGDSWTNWYQPMFEYIEKNDIKALCYINQDWNAQKMWELQGGWGDSRVQNSEEFFDKWLRKIGESRYLMSSKELYPYIGFIPKNNEQNGTTTGTDKTQEQTTQKMQKVSKPKGVKITKLKSSRKSIKVLWKKRTKGTNGYVIQYSTKKHFKSKVKAVTIKRNRITIKKIKKLKSKKKYYVRIRTFKIVKNKKYYSDWSKVKSVKTK